MKSTRLFGWLLFTGLLAGLFVGPAEAGREIVIYGDSQLNGDLTRWVIQGIMAVKPTQVFHCGDMVDQGTDYDWSRFSLLTDPLRKTAEFIPTLGNHDIQNPANLFRYFPRFQSSRWYSVDRLGIHFILLDTVSSDFSPGSPQYRWLEQDLAVRPPGTRFTLLISHVPFMCSANHQGQIAQVEAALSLLVKAGGVAATFSGHCHVYERSRRDGIFFVVTGGGGSMMGNQEYPNPYCEVFRNRAHFVAITPGANQLLVESLNPDLKLLDSFIIPTAPVP